MNLNGGNNSAGIRSAAADEVFGIVFNTMRFSIHDGPGIRTTVFLKGCPLRCSWCHNPESQDFQPHQMLFEERCRRCGSCIPVCPHNAIGDPAAGLRIPAECEACGRCAEACLAGARQMTGWRTSVSALIAEMEKDVVFFDESGGGVTLSGGEPVSQPRFAQALLTACRERGIHTVLDTCGFAAPEVFERVSALAHLVLFDLKLMDSRLHELYTGVPNEMILGNLRTLAATGKPVIVRFPLIPGVNDTDAELSALSGFVRACGLTQLNVLPYHAIGREKYQRLGLECPAGRYSVPSPQRLEEVAAALRIENLNVRVGG